VVFDNFWRTAVDVLISRSRGMPEGVAKEGLGRDSAGYGRGEVDCEPEGDKSLRAVEESAGGEDEFEGYDTGAGGGADLGAVSAGEAACGAAVSDASGPAGADAGHGTQFVKSAQVDRMMVDRIGRSAKESLFARGIAVETVSPDASTEKVIDEQRRGAHD